MLPELWESKLINLLERLNKYYNLGLKVENLDNLYVIIDSVKQQDKEIYEMFYKFNTAFESYRFIRSDRDLMMKAKDIWEMERKNFVKYLKEVDVELERLLKKKGI